MTQDYLLSILFLLLGLIFVIIIIKLFKNIILPIIIKKKTIETEINPKWIKSKLENKYGFQDIDFILAKSPFNNLPYMRVIQKDKKLRFQIILSEDTSVDDVDIIARIAISGKMYVKYNVLYPDKPLFWLSMLCYMLDGGNIMETNTSWKK